MPNILLEFTDISENKISNLLFKSYFCVTLFYMFVNLISFYNFISRYNLDL